MTSKQHTKPPQQIILIDFMEEHVGFISSPELLMQATLEMPNLARILPTLPLDKPDIMAISHHADYLLCLMTLENMHPVLCIIHASQNPHSDVLKFFGNNRTAMVDLFKKFRTSVPKPACAIKLVVRSREVGAVIH